MTLDLREIDIKTLARILAKEVATLHWNAVGGEARTLTENHFAKKVEEVINKWIKNKIKGKQCQQ